jgi:hypothetical protein
MTAQRIVLLVGRSLVFVGLFGAWSFGYHLLALGACWECSVQSGVIYALSALMVFPLLVLFLSRLRKLKRPTLRRRLLFGMVWGALMGLVVFALVGSPWRIVVVLAFWIVFWLVFPRLVSPLATRTPEAKG